MRRIFSLTCLVFCVCGAQTEQKAADQFLQCNAIFESRKAEIDQQLQMLQQRALTLQTLQNETQHLLDQRSAKVNEREKALSAKLKELEGKEAQLKTTQEENEKKLKNLIAKNEELLKEIKEASQSKLSSTYAKMKDSKAAPILQDLPPSQAAQILSTLEAKDMGKILAKMDPQKAAMLTEMLQKGPPFKDPPKPPPPPPPKNPDDEE
ncbi:MotE family protein [Helicobacter cynogastricus]|uniref:MotE family protein n=1 Tax=Helicobacter cynogastricus TaxID=329937 RepID=UPI000CF167FB|nr:MotE family protein [Helicobacter cynogastricus]